MSLDTYRFLHMCGLFLLFLGLGGVLLQSQGGKSNRMGTILHGIGLVLMLFAGFGTLARMGTEFPWPLWVWGKLVVWLLIGSLPAMHKRGVIPTKLAWIVAIGFGAAAAYLAIFQP